MEYVNLQVGATRFREALKNLNRRDRLAMIRTMFPDLSNEAKHKLCDNLDTAKVVSGTQLRLPAEMVAA
ncbi:hypothetical protein PHIM7_290 [Sinorhizobium phage phiM7]|uniref:Uncharacterized protein n=3 Tax=Emdodecavirus TaxID=1980937 RepID=S5MBN6_9CAUD|nr:hypothetical protein AB690_gp219 [Sinorhizobium phage phiM12]YP_009212533.1 hypothetical protein AVT40_gp240 [Sinorhizobium phage phiN3]YP_009601415.1 hypothetical protein FDH46_gp188 [Sinorhizobium phage phiM7]AKF13195.1 hypothetical protein PHIM19_290 [Sinorhizobium phage phiM19]AGR48008.1 hypothetical protein SmphiM12_377 [Sinorhizobium phage phiM12]AKF12835.1 hypothetical protein PHIM7_290 [Sinorhizobium phage phiM7]AKF13556.1 hypothetical protein PHIN3_293 [Sinorhizobium phage phiN3]